MITAIIVQAARDYEVALKKLDKNKNNVLAEQRKQEVERFFKSEWYRALTDIDGEKVMQEVVEKVKRKREKENDNKGAIKPSILHSYKCRE